MKDIDCSINKDYHASSAREYADSLKTNSITFLPQIQISRESGLGNLYHSAVWREDVDDNTINYLMSEQSGQSAMHPGTIAVIVVMSLCFLGIVIVCAMYCSKKSKSKQNERSRLPSPVVVDHDPPASPGCCGTGLFGLSPSKEETGTAWTARSQKSHQDTKTKLPPPVIDLDFLPFPAKKKQLPPLADVYRPTPMKGSLFSKNIRMSAASSRIQQLPPISTKQPWSKC